MRGGSFCNNVAITEHGWRENPRPASYEELHKSLLAGLLGNIGCKLEEGQHGAKAPGSGSAEYLGARGIKFHRHPGARLSKKPGKWLICAKLMKTTRFYGRGLVAKIGRAHV